MITDDDVLALFEQADPARTDDVHDVDGALDATGYLDALRQRSNDVTIIETEPERDATTRSRRWMWMAGAAAVAVAVVGGFVVLSGDDDTVETPATVPPTPAPPTTSAPTPAPAEDAVGRAEEFLVAFATGDPAAVSALQADELEMRYRWPGEGLGEHYEEFEWLGAPYQAASATVYSEPECSLIGEEAGVATVECDTRMALAMHQAANAPGVPVEMTIGVTASGISLMESAYGENLGLLAFYDWVEANRPGALPDDDDEVDLTLEGVTELARTEAELAADWAAWAVAVVEATFADHNAGDLDAFLARFERTSFTGADDDVIAAVMAGGVTYETSDCEPSGVVGGIGLRIVCDVVVRHQSHEVSRLTYGGQFGMVVSADGTIVDNSNSVDWQPALSFNNAFERWLASAHPDVHAAVTWLDGPDVASADDQPVVPQYYAEFVEQSDVYPLEG